MPIKPRWKKGESGNPRGRPPDDFGLRAIKMLTQEELATVANLILKNNVDALKAIGKDENSSVLKTMVAAVAVKIISNGDMHALDTLLNRLIGKVKDQINVTGVEAPQVILTIPSNGREENP
jgi:hypothetical protein